MAARGNEVNNHEYILWDGLLGSSGNRSTRNV